MTTRSSPAKAAIQSSSRHVSARFEVSEPFLARIRRPLVIPHDALQPACVLVLSVLQVQDRDPTTALNDFHADDERPPAS
jgi:hypothetical protein